MHYFLTLRKLVFQYVKERLTTFWRWHNRLLLHYQNSNVNVLALFCFDTSMIGLKSETSKLNSKMNHIFELLIRYAGVYARGIIGVEKKMKKVF